MFYKHLNHLKTFLLFTGEKQISNFAYNWSYKSEEYK